MSFRQTRRQEKQYQKRLEKVFQALFSSLKSANSPVEIKRILNNFNSTMGPALYKALAPTINQLTQTNKRAWMIAAQKSAKGRAIYEGLKKEHMEKMIEQIIAENAKLIKTIPQDLAQSTAKRISEWTAKGLRPEEMTRRLQQELPHLTKSQIQRIARTETSKAQSALTQARAQRLGLNWYTWRTVGDGARVRDSHQLMDGVLVNWNAPPNPEALAGVKPYGKYHAGNTFNCRCYAEPVVDFNYLPDRLKVYIKGRIVNMSRREFIRQTQ